MTLQDKVVLITGAKGGLGTYVTKAFLEIGAQVVGVSRSIKDSDFPNSRFAAVAAELSSGDAARAVADGVVSRFGRIDALVHLLGAFAGGHRVDETDDATLDQMFNLNFRSTFHILRAVIPHMRAQGSGSILAIGTRAALDPTPGIGVYAASKAALVTLMRTVAAENKDSGISANVVLPVTMDTAANRAAMPGADYSKWIQPDQVADLLTHLASARASQVTGAVIPIYGADL